MVSGSTKLPKNLAPRPLHSTPLLLHHMALAHAGVFLDIVDFLVGHGRMTSVHY